MMVLAAGLSYPVSKIKQISLCKNIKTNILLNVYTPVSNPSQIAVGEAKEYEITCIKKLTTCIFTKRIVVCLFSFGHSNVCPSSIYGF
jgi:hypothetical protein